MKFESPCEYYQSYCFIHFSNNTFDNNFSTEVIIGLAMIHTITLIGIVALTLAVVFVFIFKGKKTIIL